VSTYQESATSTPQPSTDLGASPQNHVTGDTCRESESSPTPGEIRAAYLELNRQITVKLDAYVAQAVKAKTDFDALVPLLDLMQSMLSQRGSRRRLMDTLELPNWTEWLNEFRVRLHVDVTIRTIERRLRAYRDDSDETGEPDPPSPKSLSETSETVQPGSREDRTRPIWVDQGIKVRYNSIHRRMEAVAEYVERQKEVGLVGNCSHDRILARITVWQAVYAEPNSEVDKPALAQAALTKVVSAAKDTDYFDITALKKEANKLAGAMKP
jgi:hypothetical protein